MITIVGPGLIGHSVTLALQRARPDLQVLELDRGDPLERAQGSELIVLAAPVHAILEIIRTRATLLRGSLVMDTGSTKRAVVAAARVAGLSQFVGGHPMAGGASSGPAAARADLFDGQPWFLVAGGGDAAAVRTAEQFVERLGAVPVHLHDDGLQHDRVMAAVSHLPQVVASVLMVVAAQHAAEHIDWAGAGLRDTTRLAQSGADIWQSILQSNADQLSPMIRQMADELRTLADRLDDPQCVRDLFDKANRARALL